VSALAVARPSGSARAALAARRRVGAITLYLVLSVALLIAFVPFLWVIMTSVKGNAEIFLTPFALPKSPNWGNFVTAWVEGKFSTYFFNSVAISLPSVLLILFCGSLAGFAFARLRFWGNNAIFFAFLASTAISTNTIMIPLFLMIHNLGLIDTWWGVVAPIVGSHMPLGSFLMRAFFRGLPTELEDAARIDGCGDFGVFWRVMLPLAKGALLGLAIFSFMDSWNAFLLPLLVLRDDAMRTLPLGLLIFQGQYTSDYAVLFAGMVISFVPSLAVYFALQRHFERGITIGSVKG
jgi:ABC-type glycerol-3-phosphate transport system permease component